MTTLELKEEGIIKSKEDILSVNALMIKTHLGCAVASIRELTNGNPEGPYQELLILMDRLRNTLEETFDLSNTKF